MRVLRAALVCLLFIAAAPTRPRTPAPSSPARKSAPTVMPKLIITEIQYDPASQESDDQQTEWVEIQNVGASPVNLEGLQITSGSKAKPHDPKQRFVLGNVIVKPREYAVIGIGAQQAYADLKLPPFVAYAGETHYAWLTNNGDSVAIRDAKGVVIDEVVYETESPWPVIRASGSSIQFIAPAGEDPAAANDRPENWVASDSTNSDAFPNHGRGTPGGPPKEPPATQPVKK